MKIGRNDACPCGSGLKYKKCCLTRAPVVLAYTSGDREDALNLLDRFAARAELDGERDEADREFWHPLHSRPGVGAADEDSAESSESIFEDWFLLDRVGADGLTPIEAFLERSDHRLTAGAREFLARLSRTELRGYEVSPASTRNQLHLVDLWTGEERMVKIDGMEALEAGDILAARLMPGADGGLVVEGGPLLYPGAVKDDLVEALKAAHALALRELPSGAQEVLFKSAAPVLHSFWTLIFAPAGSMVCFEALFDVTDVRRLEAVLDSHPDLWKEENGYAWDEGDGEDLGILEIEDGRLIVHCDSEEGAERGRRMVEEAAGPAVRFVGVRSEDLTPDWRVDPDHAAGTAPVIGQPPGTPSGPIQMEFGWERPEDKDSRPAP